MPEIARLKFGEPVPSRHLKVVNPQRILTACDDNGVKWFEGQGAPPAFIYGASPGDYYHDTLTGNYYRLTAGT